MKRLGEWVGVGLGAVLAACGADAGDDHGFGPMSGSGAMGGSTGLTGSMAGAESGGTANGTTSADRTCGGGLVGAWSAVNAVVQTPTTSDDCLSLTPIYRAGVLSATTRLDLQRAPLSEITWQFPSVSQDGMAPSNVYMRRRIFSGPLREHYNPECLVATDGTPVTCAELSAPLTESGFGEGAWTTVECTDSSEGGCNCTFQIEAAEYRDGEWQLAGSTVVLTPTSTEIAPLTVSYCVQGQVLHFGEELTTWPAGLDSLDYLRVNCSNGLRGSGEDGIDCGWACPSACTQ